MNFFAIQLFCGHLELANFLPNFREGKLKKLGPGASTVCSDLFFGSSWSLMILSPVSADKLAKIRVKNREPVPSYRMDRNDDELDAIMVSGAIFNLQLISIIFF